MLPRLEFATRSPFPEEDIHDPRRPAYNRRDRRYVEKLNEGERKKARQWYSETVRRLVRLVQRRDPRFDAFQRSEIARKKEEAEEKKRKEAEKKAAL